MKKIVFLILCVLTVLVIGYSSRTVDAIVEQTSASSHDMIVRTAMAQGEAYTDDALVNYVVKHGNVSAGNINQFTTYTSNESAWTASLGVSSDNAYGDHWKIHTQANDGFIFEVEAKYPVTVKVIKSVINGGNDWDDNAKINVYKKNDSTLETIKTFEIKDTSTVEDYCVEVNLSQGDILYYEFIFEWTGHRNMVDLPTYTFTYNPEAVDTPDTPNVPDTPTITQTSAGSNDMIIRTAMANGGAYTDDVLVNYTVKHGNVSAGSINQFTTYTSDASAWTASLGAEGDNAYGSHWKIFTQANDGYIFEVEAKYPVTVKVSKTSIGGDWVDDTYLNVYHKSGSTLEKVKSVALKASTEASEYEVEVDLSAGDILYYEFIFEWTSHRNMINLPTYTFTYNAPVVEEHIYGEWIEAKEPTCTEAGNLGHYLCSHCDTYFDAEYVEIEDVVIPATGHSYANEWSSDDTNHWHQATCGCLNEISNLDVHAWDNGIVTTEPTEEIEGFKTYTCTVCQKTKLESMGTLDHTHKFATELTFNDTHHWYQATCEHKDEKADYNVHNLSWSQKSPATCEEAEVLVGTCLCGYETTKAGEPALGHSYATEWSYDETHHWHQATCGCDVKGQYAEHSLVWETVVEATLIKDGEELGICDCGYEITKVIEATIEFPNYAEKDEIGLNDLAIGVAASNGQAVQLKSMEINLLQGNVFAGTKGFTNYSITTGNQINILLSDTQSFDGEESAAFTTWRMKTTSNSAAIMEIKAIEDIKLTISHPAFSGGWIDEHGQYFGLYFKANGKIYTQWTKDIVSSTADADTFGGTIMLSAGDVCYFVFGSKIANERNVDIAPIFTSSTADYDSELRQKQMVLANETVNMWDALTATINNEYNDAEYNLFDFGFYYGSVKELIKFDYHVGDGTGTAEDALWDNVIMNAGFLRWQIQCASGKDAIMKITAKENVQITIKHTAIWYEAWSTFTAVRYYAEDVEGTRVLCKEIPVINGTSDDYFGISVNLEKGQALYIDYFTNNDDWGSLNFAPSVTASCEDYDANNLVDFNSVKALDTLKENKAKELNDLYESLNEDDYSIANWGKIENYIDEALIIIDEAQTEELINSTFNDTKTSIEAVLTKVEEKAELDAYKAEKIAELNAFVSELNKKDYTEENWQLITNKVTEITEKINKIGTKTGVNTLLANAKTYINNVEKTESSGFGCMGSLVPSLFAIYALFASVIIVKRKKEE